jgi:anaerobic magnesium-protoporphyrin IX monomethyl ester cyclase
MTKTMNSELSAYHQECPKVLLINPSQGPEDEFGALGHAAPSFPQLGLACVATALINAGFETKIIDNAFDHLPTSEIIRIIHERGYKFVGFSAYITTHEKVLSMASKIKGALPDTVILVGGPQATLDPDFFSKECIDYIFIGEADDTISTIVGGHATAAEGFLPQGVLRVRNSRIEGQTQLNLIQDLDGLPFVDLASLYDVSQFVPAIYVRGKKIINVVSARGCSFQCTFCAAGQVNGRKIRTMSPTKFVDNLEILTARGFDSFVIYDDTFTLNKKRAVSISEEIIKRNLNISWNCWTRVDCIDHETLAIMHEAGCYLVNFGIETFNDSTLKTLRKGFTAEQALQGVKIAKNAGMLVVASFMIGLPGESRSDIMHTIRQVASSKIDLAVFPIFEPFPGTPIYERCQRQGRWVKSEKHKNTLLADQDLIWEPDGLNRGDIEHLAQKAFRAFYFRPHFILSLVEILRHAPRDRQKRIISSALSYFSARLRPTSRWKVGSKY